MTTLQSSLRTMNSSAKLVTTLLLCCLIGASEAYYHRFRHGRRSSTLQLLNQLCDAAQDDNSMKREACTGCFIRTRSQARGFPRLAAVSVCSDKYLNNTGYDHCQAYLRNATAAVNAKGTPLTVYCTFMECIRQVNKNTLSALSNVDLASENNSKEATIAAKKKRSALIIRQYLAGGKGFCEARLRDGNRHNYLRSGQMQHWGHRRNFRRNFRRSFRQNPFMRSQGPRNVFQFFIDSNEPRQAYRRPYRMYRDENQMRRREFNYRRWESRNGRFY